MQDLKKRHLDGLEYTPVWLFKHSYSLCCLILMVLLIIPSTLLAANSCETKGVQLQVLGSGGPEILQGGCASSSYLVWLDGKARLLVDAGGGSALNFSKTGAKLEYLDAIVLTHLHVDHSADLPAYIKASYFGDRQRDLPVFGPSGVLGAFRPNVTLIAIVYVS